MGSTPTWATRTTIRPRGAARSARLPVTQETVGSNPIGDAFNNMAWYANWQSDGFQTSVVVGSTPSRATETTCVGWALASPSGCNPPAFGLWRFDSVPAHSQTARSSNGSGYETLILVIRVRLPYGSLMISLQVRQVSNRLSYGRCARLDTETCNLTRMGQCSFGPHKPEPPGATPGSATCETTRYANRQSGHRPTLRVGARGVTILLVRRPLWSLTTLSRGPTATTLGSHPGNDGSIPSGTKPRYANRQSGSAQTRGFAGSIPALGTQIFTPSWSSGVLACLSRRRSSVQIR